MPKSQVLTSNFTAGEFSPELEGRTDLEKFAASAKKLTNVVVLRQGGATMRPSMDFKGEVKTSANATRLIEFIYSRVDAFVLEFGALVIRVWKDGALVETSPGVPLEIVTPYAAADLALIDYTQGGDTLFLFHPTYPTRRLRRFSTTRWVLDALPYEPFPMAEMGHYADAISITLSASTVGAGRTAVPSAGFFLPADVGRTITYLGGSFTITAFTSAVLVTGTITEAFTTTALPVGAWQLNGTPNCLITPSVTGPVGSPITITANVVSGAFRAEEATTPTYIEVNGGVVFITTFSSSLSVLGIVLKELIGAGTAPIDAWMMKQSVFSARYGYPRTGTIWQQRLWVGGTASFPLSFWGSRPGLYFDFLPGVADDSAVYKTIDSDRNDIIQYLMNGGDRLLVNTFGSEIDVVGGIEKPVTQNNARLTRRSSWGCSACRPTDAGADLLFVERSGSTIRAMQRDANGESAANDISIYSDHLLASGIVSLSFEQKPRSVMWAVTTAGALLAITYNREQNQVSICGGVHTGIVEWLATVPEGAIDATYALVRRTIGGVTKRYVERLNWAVYPGMDSRKQVTGAASLNWPGFSHLEGQSVAVLADDVSMGLLTVTGGVITLPRTALKVAAGLPYTAKISLAAPDPGTGTGTAQGQAMSLNRVWVRLLNTIGCTSNLQDLGFQQFDGPLLDLAPAQFTGVKSTSEAGWLDGDAPLDIEQPHPYPFTVLNVIRSFTVNAG